MMKIATAIFTFAVIVSLGQSCVLNSTHCQCATKPAGDTCLRYSSGPDDNIMCETYSCGSGVVCDCMGTDLCEHTECEREVYRPIAQLAPGSTSPVSCTRSTSTTCLVNVGPAPSPAALPSAAASPIPSPSEEPDSSTPPGDGNLNDDCTAVSCQNGLGCDSCNICKKNVALTIRTTADDGVTLYTCGGGEIGSVGLRSIAEFSYLGRCEDLIAFVPNVNFGPAGLALAIKYEGVQYATGVNLPMTVAQNPASGYLDCCAYDYSSFVDPNFNPIFDGNRFPVYGQMSSFGGAIMQSHPSALSYPTGFFVFRIPLPFCNVV